MLQESTSNQIKWRIPYKIKATATEKLFPKQYSNDMVWYITSRHVLADTNGPSNALRHIQSSSCCAQSWTLSVIDRQR